jgi:GNAT superfamily N-acetyltransferase
MKCALVESDADIAACCSLLAELRPRIHADDLCVQVARQRKHGYQLACSKDRTGVLAVAGFRVAEKLAWGKHIYIDDLVARSNVRSQGVGRILFDWVVERAREWDCKAVHLDSGLQNFAAHRFYLRQGLAITSHHFKLDLEM